MINENLNGDKQIIPEKFSGNKNESDLHSKLADIKTDEEILDDLNDLSVSRIRVWLIIILLSLIVTWSIVFHLDVASRSIGEVIPATKTKPIQHLEGGIVNKILVSEGEQVKRGQVLIELQKVASESDLSVLETQIASLQIKYFRLQAQLDNRSVIKFTNDLEHKYPTQTATAQLILEASRKRYLADHDVKLRKIEQRKAELTEIVYRNKHLSEKLDLLRKQLAIIKKLLANGLMNEYEQFNLLKEEKSLVGAIGENVSAIKRIKSGVAQAQSELDSLESIEKESLETELEKINNGLNELLARQLKFTDTQKRLLVVAPTDAIILHLNVITEGAVVSPGGTLLSLVPIDDPLLIEAQLPIGDVGLVQIGQKARIELMSSVARGFLPITGEVIYVSADRVVNEEGMPFYKVRIKPNSLSFYRGKQSFKLIPGVTVQVSVLVGSRSVAAYLTEPLRRASNNALSEL